MAVDEDEVLVFINSMLMHGGTTQVTIFLELIHKVLEFLRGLEGTGST